MTGSRVRIVRTSRAPRTFWGVRVLLAVLTWAPLVVGCGGGQGSASCAFAVDHGDRIYVDVGDVEYRLGAQAGTARQSICDDTGGSEEDRDDIPAEEPTLYEAYAIQGVDTADAIAVRESPGDEPSVMVHSAEDEPLTQKAERIFGEK